MQENIVEIIEDLLNDEWAIEAVCGDNALCGHVLCGYENDLDAIPQIFRQGNDPKRVDLATEDMVKIYEINFSKEPGDITYATEDIEGSVSVDVRTVNSEAQFKALYTEIERIRKFKRKNPHADYDRWDFVRKTLFHRPLSWRAVVDYKFLRANVAL